NTAQFLTRQGSTVQPGQTQDGANRVHRRDQCTRPSIHALARRRMSRMRTTVSILPFVGRTIALILIVLGLLFWTGNATTLIPLHMLLGVTLVLLLWTLAILGVIARVNPGLIAMVFVWSLIVPILGVTQTQLLPGPAHWLIRLLHLLVGLVAIVLADTLAKAIKRRYETKRATAAGGVAQGVRTR